MSRIKAILDSFAAAMDLKRAEIRTGISLIEAVAADQFECDLRMVANSEQERADLRDIAIEAGKLGIASKHDLVPMIQAATLSRYQLMKLRNSIDGYLGKEAP